jgi:4-carboxymuconolactone decarboxylase
MQGDAADETAALAARTLREILGTEPDGKPHGSPFLAELSRDVYLTRVWTRTDRLDMRSRRLLTIAALTATNAAEELAMHVEGALRSGDLTADELGEAAASLAFHLGWPRARLLAKLVGDTVERLEG